MKERGNVLCLGCFMVTGKLPGCDIYNQNGDSSSAAETQRRVCVCFRVYFWALIGRTFCQSRIRKGGHTWLHRLDWQAQGTNHRSRPGSEHMEKNCPSFCSYTVVKIELSKLLFVYIFLKETELFINRLSSIRSFIPLYFLYVASSTKDLPAYKWVWIEALRTECSS